MRIDTHGTVWARSSTRSTYAASAIAAFLALVLLTCTGCDDSIREELRQGAFEVFETGVDTFYDELGYNLVDALEDLGDDGTGSTTTNAAAGGDGG